MMKIAPDEPRGMPYSTEMLVYAGIRCLIVVASAFPMRAQAFGPYMWIDTQTQVLFDTDGAIAALKESWVFDPGYSAKVLDDIRKNPTRTTVDGLAAMAKTNVTSLADYGYFIVVDADGTKVAFRKPFDYFLEERADKRLVLHFTLPLTQPTRAGKAFTIQLTDPAFFVAFDYAKSQPLSLVNARAECTSKDRPGPEAKAVTDAWMHENGFVKWRAHNVNVVVSCPSR